ncbi:MAG: ParB N-terminal domain-containing protein [Butyrivibrio sp.]|nr:ParB N-terminal domain-containing protein [Butyrivibrio sp.]
MAEEQSKGIQIEGCSAIYDMGSGLVIAKVQIDKVKEQDINARIMKNEMQDQLTANIMKRGQLESLPFFVLNNGKLEIISGHHRVKSARAAGLKEVIAIIDVSGLTRSQIAAKQLAHNAISGFDDDSTLREIVKMITDVDDMIESFVGKDIMEEPLEQYDKMLSPAVQFDFKNVTFSFLPHQVQDMDALIKNLEITAPEIIGVASYEQCKSFVETLSRYQKFTDIRNIGAAIHSMIQNANERMDEVGFNEEEEWTYLAKLFGSNAVPGESAKVIQQAIKKAEKEGTVTSKNRWQLIEYLCADYLSGR